MYRASKQASKKWKRDDDKITTTKHVIWKFCFVLKFHIFFVALVCWSKINFQFVSIFFSSSSSVFETTAAVKQNYAQWKINQSDFLLFFDFYKSVCCLSKSCLKANLCFSILKRIPSIQFESNQINQIDDIIFMNVIFDIQKKKIKETENWFD